MIKKTLYEQNHFDYSFEVVKLKIFARKKEKVVLQLLFLHQCPKQEISLKRKMQSKAQQIGQNDFFFQVWQPKLGVQKKKNFQGFVLRVLVFFYLLLLQMGKVFKSFLFLFKTQYLFNFFWRITTFFQVVSPLAKKNFFLDSDLEKR